MMRFLPSSIGARFALSSIALILLAGAPMASFTVEHGKERDRIALAEKGSAILEYLEWTLQFDMELEDGPRIQEQLDSMRHIPEANQLTVTSSNGELLANWNTNPPADHDEQLDVKRQVIGTDGLPLGTLSLALSTERILAAEAEMVHALLIFGGTVLGAVTLVSTLLGLRVSHRLKKLAITSKALSLGDFNARADETGRDETGKLASAFNRMAGRIAKRERQLEESRQEAVEQAAKAKEAEEAKGRFLATMSHEIRTPMNGLLGMADLLLETRLNEEQHEYASTLRNSGDSLLAILSDILDYSKVTAGKIDLEAIDFDLDDLLEDTVDLFASKGAEHDLKLLSTVEAIIPNTYVGDPGRLRQVLANLVGNAVKFTAEGSVHARVRLIGQKGNADLLRFEVIDTGKGISEEGRQRLFQPFEQTDASMSRKYGGTGLGLSISKEFVGLMGGEIGVDSTLGKGSTFWFTVPLKAADVQRAVPEKGVQDQRVLLVCNCDVACSFGRAKLLRRGIQYQAVSRMAEALQILQTNSRNSEAITSVIVGQDILKGKEEAVLNALQKSAPGIPLFRLGNESEDDRVGRDDWSAIFSLPLHSRKLLVALRSGKEGYSPENSPTRMAIISEELPTLNVLVVDDNKVNRMVAQRMLNKMGCTVFTANDGKEGLEAAARQNFDLVFMDIQMPVMDGLDSLRAIRQLSGARAKVPIYMLSANAGGPVVKVAEQAGGNGFLVKPFKVEDLAGILRIVAADISEPH